MKQRSLFRPCGSCSLLFIPLAGVEVFSASYLVMVLTVAALTSWLVWKSWMSFRKWGRRDPLALRKLMLAIQVLATELMACVVVLQLQSLSKSRIKPKNPQQPKMPTCPSGVMPEPHESPPCGARLPLHQPSHDKGDQAPAESPRLDYHSDAGDKPALSARSVLYAYGASLNSSTTVLEHPPASLKLRRACFLSG